MRFCLHSGVNEVRILNGVQNGKSSCANVIVPEINPYDESDPSKCSLQQLQKCFKEQFSCSADDYFKFLGKAFNQGNLNLRWDWNSDTGALTLTITGRILKVLKDVFGPNSEIRITLREANAKLYTVNWENLTTEPSVNDVVTEGMTIAVSDDICGTCVDKNVDIPKPWKPYLMIPDNRSVDIYFYAKIRIEFSSCASNFMWSTLTHSYSEVPQATHRHSDNLCKKMLEEGIQADVTIITRDGAEVKCHKSFLAAQSPVFTAMFRSDCKESSTSKIEMPEIDEVIVKAFLAYLYYGDLTEAEANSNIAFDLFEAGHKYEVKTLEEITKHILLHKSNDWIDVGVVLRLFSIYGKMEGYENLRTKAIQVMREKFGELEESEDYNHLFDTDPQGAKELCKWAFGIQ